jgi:glycosyltransferase involved in cell wall biosynthesis
MKNLAGALRLLGALRGRVTFDIYGPLEDPAYWQECQDLISPLPPNINVKYCGTVPYPNVRNVLSGYDLFLLPTLGENFGHAISDALVAGCPVLISDQTPWRDLERLNVGWDLPLDQPAVLQEALQRCIDMPPEDHTALCARAHAFGLQRSEDPEVLTQNRNLFLRALERAYSKTAVKRPAANLI